MFSPTVRESWSLDNSRAADYRPNHLARILGKSRDPRPRLPFQSIAE